MFNSKLLRRFHTAWVVLSRWLRANKRTLASGAVEQTFGAGETGHDPSFLTRVILAQGASPEVCRADLDQSRGRSGVAGEHLGAAASVQQQEGVKRFGDPRGLLHPR